PGSDHAPAMRALVGLAAELAGRTGATDQRTEAAVEKCTSSHGRPRPFVCGILVVHCVGAPSDPSLGVGGAKAGTHRAGRIPAPHACDVTAGTRRKPPLDIRGASPATLRTGTRRKRRRIPPRHSPDGGRADRVFEPPSVYAGAAAPRRFDYNAAPWTRNVLRGRTSSARSSRATL